MQVVGTYGEGDVLVNASFNRKRLWKNNTFLFQITHPPSSYVPALVIEVPLLTLRSGFGCRFYAWNSAILYFLAQCPLSYIEASRDSNAQLTTAEKKSMWSCVLYAKMCEPWRVPAAVVTCHHCNFHDFIFIRMQLPTSQFPDWVWRYSFTETFRNVCNVS